MSGIEDLALFIAAITSTLLGFIAIVFIFWASTDQRYIRDKLKQNKSIVFRFQFLAGFAIIIILFSFITIYNATIDPNGNWQPIFLIIDTIGFLIFIISMAIFFTEIIQNLIGK